MDRSVRHESRSSGPFFASYMHCLVKGGNKGGPRCQFSPLQAKGLGLQSVQSIAIIIHVILMRFFLERYSKTLM